MEPLLSSSKSVKVNFLRFRVFLFFWKAVVDRCHLFADIGTYRFRPKAASTLFLTDLLLGYDAPSHQ